MNHFAKESPNHSTTTHIGTLSSRVQFARRIQYTHRIKDNDYYVFHDVTNPVFFHLISWALRVTKATNTKLVALSSNGGASKCYILITPTTLLLLIPTVRATAVHGYATIDGGREERPPSPKCDGGASAAR